MLLLALAAIAALSLTACVRSSGERAISFTHASTARIYQPLSATLLAISARRGAAVLVASQIAVTAAHNANLVAAGQIIGRSAEYDLLFFRTDRPGPPVTTAIPRLNERVLAYGEGADGELRVARGVVTSLSVPVTPICRTCRMQSAFAVAGDAGKGFSGGPVVDSDDGRLLGIVFGYRADGGQTVYAYDMDHVLQELAEIERRPPHSPS